MYVISKTYTALYKFSVIDDSVDLIFFEKVDPDSLLSSCGYKHCFFRTYNRKTAFLL